MTRPPKAAAIQRLTGAWDKDPNRERTGEPIPPTDDPVKPKLKGRASKIWDEYAPICIGMGTLSRGDELEFATWCNMQAEYEKDPEGCQTSRIAQKRAAAERFGIAGAGSRAKLGVKGGSQDEKDPAEDFFTTSRSSNAVRQ